MQFSAQGLHARSFKTSRTIAALVLREMQTTYGRSPGGYLWAVLEPVGAVAILSIVFSVAFSAPALGSNFPLFYATGYLPFMAYADLAAKIGQSIRFSRPLLAYPAVSYIDTILARFILNALTHILVFYIVMSSIVFFFDLRVILTYPAILNAIAMAVSLGLGVGTLNCFLLTRFPIWERVWALIMRPMFIASAIFFLFDSIPEPYSDYLWFNPLIHVVGEMRRGFYATYDADYVSAIYSYSFALICFFFGLVLLGRYHRVLLNKH